MYHTEVAVPEATVDSLQLCPICRKLFLQEKALYKHIVSAHQDREYLSYNLRADLYQRWQERIPRFSKQ